MIRRDMLLDPDRPRYYSQFWVDVASGKRSAAVVDVADVEDATDLATDLAADLDLDLNTDAAIEAVEPPILVQPAPKKVEPKKADAKKAEPKKAEPITSLADLAKIEALMKSSAEMDSDTIPDIAGAVASPNDVDIVTDFDLNAVEPEVEEPLDATDAENYDEEDDWGSGEDEPRRGSKPNKRRDTRRDSRDVRRDF